MFEAQRMKDIPFSAIRAVFEEVHRREAEGQDIVSLCIGRPDFDTPANIKEAAKKALDDGHVHYASNAGVPTLCQAIADKFERDNGLHFDPASEILVTVGANEAVFLAMTAFLDPGDEALLPDPFWPHYEPCVRLAGAVPVSVPLREENSFNPVREDLESRCTDRTRMIILNSPHNPTGAVFTRKTLQAVADLAQQRDLLVVADEIYEKLIHAGEGHTSIASLPGMRERTITINGFSKAYAMTGWRLGYLGVDRSLMSPLFRAHQYTTVCVTTFAQHGAVEALTGPQGEVRRMTAEFSRRRNLVSERLAAMPGISFGEPQGAFYVMVNVTGLGLTGQQAATALLDHGVAVTPWDGIGQYGKGFIRLSYANSFEQLEKAMDRMAVCFAEMAS